MKTGFERCAAEIYDNPKIFGAVKAAEKIMNGIERGNHD